MFSVSIKQLLVCCLFFLCSQVGHTFAREFHTHTTAESMARSGYEYLWSVIQDEFDSFETDDQEAENRRQELIDIFIRTGCTYNQPFKMSSFGLEKLYPQLIELDPDPPLYVQYRYHSSQASNYYDSPDKDFIGHAEALLQIVKRMEEREYPDYVVGATWLRTAEFFRDGDAADDERAVYASHRGIETLIRAASLDQIKPEFQEYVAIRIARNGWQYSALTTEDKQLFCEKLLNDKDADPWIGLYANASRNRTKAWDARGSGWARDVNDKQWELFGRYMNQSNRDYAKAWSLRPQWPEPAVEMIGNTMGGGQYNSRDEFFWFTEATNARIDHEKAYVKFAYALTPRWGGSIEAMLSLTEHVIELAQEQDHMSYIFQECISAMAKEVPSETAKEIVNHYRPMMTQMIDEEILDPLPYKNKWQHRSLLRTIAKFNFKAGEYEHASRLLREGGGMTDRLWTPWTAPASFQNFAPLLSTPAYKHVIEGLKALDSDNPETAIEPFERALAILEAQDTVLDPELSYSYEPIDELRDQIGYLD